MAKARPSIRARARARASGRTRAKAKGRTRAAAMSVTRKQYGGNKELEKFKKRYSYLEELQPCGYYYLFLTFAKVICKEKLFQKLLEDTFSKQPTCSFIEAQRTESGLLKRVVTTYSLKKLSHDAVANMLAYESASIAILTVGNLVEPIKKFAEENEINIKQLVLFFLIPVLQKVYIQCWDLNPAKNQQKLLKETTQTLLQNLNFDQFDVTKENQICFILTLLQNQYLTPMEKKMIKFEFTKKLNHFYNHLEGPAEIMSLIARIWTQSLNKLPRAQTPTYTNDMSISLISLANIIFQYFKKSQFDIGLNDFYKNLQNSMKIQEYLCKNDRHRDLFRSLMKDTVKYFNSLEQVPDGYIFYERGICFKKEKLLLINFISYVNYNVSYLADTLFEPEEIEINKKLNKPDSFYSVYQFDFQISNVLRLNKDKMDLTKPLIFLDFDDTISNDRLTHKLNADWLQVLGNAENQSNYNFVLLSARSNNWNNQVTELLNANPSLTNLFNSILTEPDNSNSKSEVNRALRKLVNMICLFSKLDLNLKTEIEHDKPLAYKTLNRFIENNNLQIFFLDDSQINVDLFKNLLPAVKTIKAKETNSSENIGILTTALEQNKLQPILNAAEPEPVVAEPVPEVAAPVPEVAAPVPVVSPGPVLSPEPVLSPVPVPGPGPVAEEPVPVPVAEEPGPGPAPEAAPADVNSSNSGVSSSSSSRSSLSSRSRASSRSSSSSSSTGEKVYSPIDYKVGLGSGSTPIESTEGASQTVFRPLTSAPGYTEVNFGPAREVSVPAVAAQAEAQPQESIYNTLTFQPQPQVEPSRNTGYDVLNRHAASNQSNPIPLYGDGPPNPEPLYDVPVFKHGSSPLYDTPPRSVHPYLKGAQIAALQKNGPPVYASLDEAVVRIRKPTTVASPYENDDVLNLDNYDRLSYFKEDHEFITQLNYAIQNYKRSCNKRESSHADILANLNAWAIANGIYAKERILAKLQMSCEFNGVELDKKILSDNDFNRKCQEEAEKYEFNPRGGDVAQGLARARLNKILRYKCFDVDKKLQEILGLRLPGYTENQVAQADRKTETAIPKQTVEQYLWEVVDREHNKLYISNIMPYLLFYYLQLNLQTSFELNSIITTCSNLFATKEKDKKVCATYIQYLLTRPISHFLTNSQLETVLKIKNIKKIEDGDMVFHVMVKLFCANQGEALEKLIQLIQEKINEKLIQLIQEKINEKLKKQYPQQVPEQEAPPILSLAAASQIKSAAPQEVEEPKVKTGPFARVKNWVKAVKAKFSRKKGGKGKEHKRTRRHGFFNPNQRRQSTKRSQSTKRTKRTKRKRNY